MRVYTQNASSSADPTRGMLPGAELQALEEAMTVINEWTPASDVFALKHHPVAVGVFSSGTAAYLNAYYRRVVKLRHHAFITTLIPVVVLPSIVSPLLHQIFVVKPLVLQQYKCPVCLEMRGGALQFFAGFVYPLVLAPFAAFQFAVRLYTYPVPDITKPLLWIKEFHKLTKPVIPRLYLLAGLQIIVGTAWTHWEALNLITVMSKLAYMEEEIERRRQESPLPPHV